MNARRWTERYTSTLHEEAPSCQSSFFGPDVTAIPLAIPDDDGGNDCTHERKGQDGADISKKVFLHRCAREQDIVTASARTEMDHRSFHEPASCHSQS